MNVNRFMMRYIKLVCSVVLLCFALTASAQEDEGQISVVCEAFSTPSMGPKAGEKTRIAAAFNVFTTAMAADIKKEFDRWDNEIKKNPNNQEYAYAKIEQWKRKYGLNKVRKNGIFTRKMLPGRSIVVVDAQDNCWVVDVMPGREKYETVAKVVSLDGEVNAIGKDRRTTVPVSWDTEDGNQVFNIKFGVDEKLLKDDARLIVRCVALDCQTEDTVDYTMTLVYEGGTYHVLQDKRKDYDFNEKDSLSRVYRSTFDNLTWDDGQLRVDTFVVFKKPNSRKSYRPLTQYTVEDYHTQFKYDEVRGGCLSIRPFKFLDFSTSVPEMELHENFKADEEVQDIKIERDLDLRFVTGRATLREDSVNDIQSAALIAELKSYGSRLVDPKIIGSASPEGADANNKSLAQQRADVARRMILPHLVKGINVSTDIKVYTWVDVANRMEQIGLKEQADAVRSKIEEIGADKDIPLDRAIYSLSCYNDTIKPLLQTFQIMKCGYSYVKEHIYTPEEVLQEFNLHKEAYRTGKKQFTSGDYYNLFAQVEDSVDRDTLTNMAYRFLTRPGYDYRFDPLTPYVFDRKQRMCQNMGLADTLMLGQFIDVENDKITHLESDTKANKMVDGVQVRINYSGHIVTQAISYFLLQKFGPSQSYIDWLKGANAMVPGLENIEHFMNVKTLSALSQHANLTPEQEQKLKVAKDHVLGSSIENKAILYTELSDWAAPAEAEKWVDMLDDDNPKKWYLKGILWARKVKGKKGLLDMTQPDLTPYIDDESQADTEDEDLLQVPHYLAYFHHCFKLRPEYRNFYFNDGHIDENQRMDFPYTRSQVPAYEKLFKLLQKRDAESRAKHMENEGMDTSSEDELTEETAQAQ